MLPCSAGWDRRVEPTGEGTTPAPADRLLRLIDESRGLLDVRGSNIASGLVDRPRLVVPFRGRGVYASCDVFSEVDQDGDMTGDFEGFVDSAWELLTMTEEGDAVNSFLKGVRADGGGGHLAAE